MEIESKGGDGEQKPILDVFGTERGADGKPVVPEAPAPAPVDPKDKKPEDKKPEEPAPTDIEKNPVVVELRTQLKQLTDDKSSMGGNLSAQGKAIEALKKKLAAIEGGEKPGGEPLFKDIKRVKDLTKDEQEAMSESEKKIFDELADTREAMNKQVADAAKEKSEAATAAETEAEEADAVETFNKNVQSEVLALVGSTDGRPTAAQKELANQIIEEFNAFADNDKLTPSQRKERIEKAAKLVPDYKPAKEQKSPTGTAPRPTDNGGDSAIDKIVEETAKHKGGGSYAL